MNRISSFLVVFALACSSSSPAPQPTAPAPNADQAVTPAPSPFKPKIDAYIESYGSVRGAGYAFSGHVHAVRGGEVVYSRGFGRANHMSGAANGADTSFRIGSVTKQFTSAAIFLLEKQGRLSRTDVISKHLPAYPKDVASKVTIDHLLKHTAGLPNYTNDRELMEKRDQPMTTAALLASFSKKPLDFEPGSKFAYSNSGYVVLGAIIEAVTAKSYGEAMAELVFKPAGLLSTEVGDAPDAKDRALGYETDEKGGIKEAMAIDMSTPHAAGAIRSTSADLVRWHSVLSEGKLLDLATQEAMWKVSDVSVTEDKDAKRGYASGWQVVVDKKRGKTIVRHGGGIDGFLTSFIRVPEDDLVIVAWSNNQTLGPQPMAGAVLAASYGESIEPHVETAAVAITPAAVARLVGTFELTADAEKEALAKGVPAGVLKTIKTIEVAAHAESIQMKPIGQEPVPLEAKSETLFEFQRAGIRVSFQFLEDKDPSSKAEALVIEQGPLKLKLDRKK